jgi:hypothetical protein
MEVREYHVELTARLSKILAERLLGVYAAGSFALGDFDPTRSDLDVIAVCRGMVTAAEKSSIVDALRQEVLPCPARKLELVLYPEETARVPSARAGFLLNLNTGPGSELRVDLAPGEIEEHWFPIDRAVVREAGRALAGPPPDELFAPLPRAVLLSVVRDALAWHRAAGDANAVLNACRSLRWARTGLWSSKGEAGGWALDEVSDRELVAIALGRRAQTGMPDQGRVAAFVDWVLNQIV